MKIALGSDHAGFRYKSLLAEWLRVQGHEVVDFGTHSEVACDYPDFVKPAAQAVATRDCEVGIVLGGSGNGEAIAANKVRGVRCALCWNVESASLAKTHNNANVIAIGQRMVSEEMAVAIVRAWLEARYEGGRHEARLAKLEVPTE